MRAAIFSIFLMILAGASMAETRQTLGVGRLMTNDYFADGHDRWRSGSYVISLVRGPEWQGARPTAMGSLLEYRLRSEVISNYGSVEDRPYVGLVSLGVHTHFNRGGTDFSLGADLVMLGPQTGVSGFQDWFHDLFSLPLPAGIDNELGNAFHVSATAEASRVYALSGNASLRPFVELQAGVEDIARIGADVIIGGLGRNGLMLRDVVTGQLYQAVEGDNGGLSYMLGADFAAVGGSVFLPDDRGVNATDSRWRARAGMHWQLAPKVSFYYGVTYLSEEFEDQGEGQLLGSLKLNFNF